ncbi:STAS-like domain-containing protein [Pseudoalteromonas spongiae]|uniref:STAS-like domain-containing protein n=1 Tax=Pseudoalteromonas spongiae TaxID=298657 RepID=UPI00110BFC7B|nr:DUF4325 domain-containing protein [Pseudoalteromonas spongiae]TMO84209.1 hypothetical protein CWC15_11420 [Pseudoalteromonas spongiae]
MKIDIAKDFSKVPFGRDEKDRTEFHGKNFRTKHLLPAFRDTTEEVHVYLDGVERGYGSSFLDESFAGLIREGIPYSDLENRLIIHTRFSFYKEDIWDYIKEEHTGQEA